MFVNMYTFINNNQEKVNILVKQVLHPHKLPNCALGNSTIPLQGFESGPCNSKKVARNDSPTTAQKK